MSAQPGSTIAPTSRAVFLDVDGTYADYGIVPDGHVRAVQAAREAGHKVLLCTGRPRPMLSTHILEAGFDGLVASAGAYVEVDGEVLLDRRFPPDLADRTVAALDANDAIYILESQEALHVPAAAAQRLKEIIEEHFHHGPNGQAAGASAILDSVKILTDGIAVPFAKVSVFDAPLPVTNIAEEIGPAVAVVDNSIADEGRHTGELFQHGISKADGVAAAIARLGIRREDTIGVGDGQNDLEMLAYVCIGIAIEGSSPELMAVAQRTAAPPNKEGLVAAFKELGLY